MHSLLKVPSERHQPKQLSMHLNMTPPPTSTIADPRFTDPEVTWGGKRIWHQPLSLKVFCITTCQFRFLKMCGDAKCIKADKSMSYPSLLLWLVIVTVVSKAVIHDTLLTTVWSLRLITVITWYQGISQSPGTVISKNCAAACPRGCAQGTVLGGCTDTSSTNQKAFTQLFTYICWLESG